MTLSVSIAESTLVCFYFFFFFQAEDGIRDLTVTGVQTCALPIFRETAVFHERRGGPRQGSVLHAEPGPPARRPRSTDHGNGRPDDGRHARWVFDARTDAHGRQDRSQYELLVRDEPPADRADGARGRARRGRASSRRAVRVRVEVLRAVQEP